MDRVTDFNSMDFRLKTDKLSKNFRNIFKRKLAHALHTLHTHVEKGFIPWIVRLSSIVIVPLYVWGETSDGAQAPEAS